MLVKILLTFLIAFNTYALKVETFNAGLAYGFVDYAKERKPKILEALQKSESDILCLQEVWTKKDQKKFKKSLKKKYPYSYFIKPKQIRTQKRPSCRIKQIFGEGKFVSCMQSQCGDASGDEFTDCIIDKCGNALENLKKENRQCAQALMAKVGKNPILSILSLVNPIFKAGLFAYKGGNGLMLLSKTPLFDKSTIDMSDISTLNRRSALRAKTLFNGEEINLFCTHTSAKLNVPYTGVNETWAGENLAQTKRLISATKDLKKVVLMGDFNCSLADKPNGIGSELEASCRLLKSHFQDPLSDVGTCT